MRKTLAITLGLLIAMGSVAHADEWDREHGDRDRHEHEEHEREWREHERREHDYAPPPVYYAPREGYYAPPLVVGVPNGLNIVVPLHIH